MNGCRDQACFYFLSLLCSLIKFQTITVCYIRSSFPHLLYCQLQANIYPVHVLWTNWFKFHNTSLGSLCLYSSNMSSCSFCFQENKRLLIPQVSSLISSCWSHDPLIRPAARRVCTMFRELALYSLDKIVSLASEGIVGDCCVLHWSRHIPVSG